MPANTKPQATAESVYPNLERYLETHDRAETGKLFEQTKDKLAELSAGPKGPNAKKALAGIERAEELLSSLQDVREKLEEKAKAGKKARR